MSERGRWLRPFARCPECKAFPPLRIPEKERERYAGVHPMDAVSSIQCGRCKAFYVLTAEAYQGAA